MYVRLGVCVGGGLQSLKAAAAAEVVGENGSRYGRIRRSRLSGECVRGGGGVGW